MKCREGERILGLDVVTTEDGAGWLAFPRGMRARRLEGVKRVISDAHSACATLLASVPSPFLGRCVT